MIYMTLTTQCPWHFPSKWPRQGRWWEWQRGYGRGSTSLDHIAILTIADAISLIFSGEDSGKDKDGIDTGETGQGSSGVVSQAAGPVVIRWSSLFSPSSHQFDHHHHHRFVSDNEAGRAQGKSDKPDEAMVTPPLHPIFPFSPFKKIGERRAGVEHQLSILHRLHSVPIWRLNELELYIKKNRQK